MGPVRARQRLGLSPSSGHEYRLSLGSLLPHLETWLPALENGKKPGLACKWMVQWDALSARACHVAIGSISLSS